MSHPRTPSAAKLLPLREIVEALGHARKRGQSIVFTNGCYDLLHVGHLRLLETAAALGDLLVVGLNDDASVRKLKGQGRPFVPFVERGALLAGLEVVDFVVGFAEDTPASIIESVLPDVLVKGGDWEVERIVGRETVERRGGRVLSLPLLPGHSTSRIVERIRGTTEGHSAGSGS